MTLMLLLTVTGCLLFAFYAGLIAYYRRAWNNLPAFVPDTKAPRTKISVLIPVRNEADNIAGCLESLSHQSYPRNLYQVIVIDDHSTDGTWDILQGIQYEGLNKVCLRLTDGTHKKFAIETGIGIASGDLILTTDADCLFTPDWLQTIAAFHEEKKAKFIAAPVRIGEPHGKRRSLLSIFQTLDFITLQGITGAAIYKKFHSMCNGANLAYEKNVFYEVEGFKGIDDIPSGDDMLLMHKIFMRYPEQVFFLKSPLAVVSTQPEISWKGFINQRVRWASKADRYDDRRIFWVLLLVWLVNLFFGVLVVAAFWNTWWLWLLLVCLAAKTIAEYPFVHAVAAFFGQDRLLPWFPILQPLHILYTLVIGWWGKFGSYHWKNRKITK